MHSPYNRTQTPIRTSMSSTSPVRRRPHSNSSSGSQYLQNALGDVLAEALSQVAKKRPADPIQYVADYLHSVSSDDSQRLGSKDSGHVSDSVPNRHLGSDADRPDSRENDRRSRRDVHKDDDNRSEKDHFGTISTRRDVDNLSANTLSTGRSNNRRRRRRSRNRDIETRSLPPIGKPGSTTTNSTASTDKSYTNRNRHRSVSRNRNRSVSVNRANDYNRRRDRSHRRKSYSKYDDNLDDEESVEGNYYAQMKIGKKDVVSKKRSNISPAKRKPTTFSRRLPAVADYHPDEYKSKRGMNSNVKLPPMSQSPSGRTFSTSDPSSLSSNGSYGSRGGVRKPRQLEPLEADISTFDSRKHRKRTQKLVDQRYR